MPRGRRFPRVSDAEHLLASFPLEMLPIDIKEAKSCTVKDLAAMTRQELYSYQRVWSALERTEILKQSAVCYIQLFLSTLFIE